MFLETFKSDIFHIFFLEKKLNFEALDFKFVEQNTISNGAPNTETHVKFWNNMSCSPKLKAVAKWIWIYINKYSYIFLDFGGVISSLVISVAILYNFDHN